ncbi:MAG TPA: hypothetical protein VGM28_02910 [Candidatus Limnocylindrales bacterium]|jgi:hypothetical protein
MTAGVGSFLVCAACHAPAPASALLVVTDTTGRAPTRLVHRPTTPGRATCFLSIGVASRYRIALAETRPRPAAPAPTAGGQA